MTLEERVARLEATEEIRRLHARYTTALDAADFTGIVGCFWPDGVFQFQDQSWHGTVAIEDYFTKDRVSHPHMCHYAVNIVVEIDELDERLDGLGRAVADSYLWDLFNRATTHGLEGSVLVGNYRAFVSRRDEEWRFDRLAVSARWVVPAAQAWRMSGNFEPRPELRAE
jgi:hypothetical protein